MRAVYRLKGRQPAVVGVFVAVGVPARTVGVVSINITSDNPTVPAEAGNSDVCSGCGAEEGRGGARSQTPRRSFPSPPRPTPSWCRRPSCPQTSPTTSPTSRWSEASGPTGASPLAHGRRARRGIITEMAPYFVAPPHIRMTRKSARSIVEHKRLITHYFQ